MAKTRALVKRRKAIRNIRKITRTMELIATARFKKAMDRATQAEAYTRKIAELAADLSASATNIKHPLLEVHDPVKNAVVLVLTSNRGLCGGYNGSIIREGMTRIRAVQAAGQTLQLELSGKRAIAYCKYQGIAAAHSYINFEDKPTFDEVEVLADRYIEEYVAGKIDRVDIVYMKFINPAKQVPVVETLLPLSSVQVETRKGPAVAAAGLAKKVDYEFLPDAKSILEHILPEAVKVRLFKCFLDAAVSEQIARRSAMKAATTNAGDMIKAISREYNRARQAQITKEIAEVIGGAAALE